MSGPHGISATPRPHPSASPSPTASPTASASALASAAAATVVDEEGAARLQWFLDSLPPPTESWEVGVSFAVALLVTLSLLTVLAWLLCHRRDPVTARLFLTNISLTVATGIVWIWCGMWDAHLSTERITSPSQVPDPFHCVVIGYWGTWVVGYGGTVSLLLSCVLKLHYITTGGGAARRLIHSAPHMSGQLTKALRSQFCCGWWWWLSLFPILSMAVFGLVVHYALPSEEAIQFNLAEGCVLADTARAVFTTLVLSHTVVVTVAVRMYQSATHKYFQMPPWFYVTTWVSMAVFATMEVLAWSTAVHDSPVYRTCAVVAISLSVLAFVLSRLNRDTKALAAEDMRAAIRRAAIRMRNNNPPPKRSFPPSVLAHKDDDDGRQRQRQQCHKWPVDSISDLMATYSKKKGDAAYTELDEDKPLCAEVMGVQVVIDPLSGETRASTPLSERRRLSCRQTPSPTPPQSPGVRKTKSEPWPLPKAARLRSPLRRMSRVLREDDKTLLSSPPRPPPTQPVSMAKKTVISRRRSRPRLGRSSSLRGIGTNARREGEGGGSSPRERGTFAFRGEFEFLDLGPGGGGDKTTTHVMEPGARQHYLADVEAKIGTPMHGPGRHKRVSLLEAMRTKSVRALPMPLDGGGHRFVVSRSSRAVIRVKEFINWLLEAHPFLVQALLHLHLRERGTKSNAATHFGAVVLCVLETFITPSTVRWEDTKATIFSSDPPDASVAFPCSLQPAPTQAVTRIAAEESSLMSSINRSSRSGSPPTTPPRTPPTPWSMGRSLARGDTLGATTTMNDEPMVVFPRRRGAPTSTPAPASAPAPAPAPATHEDPFDIDDGLLPVMSANLATREAAATAVMNELEEFIAGCATETGVPEWVDTPAPVREALAGHADVTLASYWNMKRFVGYPLSAPPSSADTYIDAHLMRALFSFRISKVDGLLSLMPLKAALRVRLTQVFEVWSLGLLASIQDGTDPLTNLDSAGMMGPGSPPVARRTVVNLGDVLRGSPAATVRRMDPWSAHEKSGGTPAFGSTFSDVGLGSGK